MDRRPKHKICRVSKPLYFIATSGFKLHGLPDLRKIGSPLCETGKSIGNEVIMHLRGLDLGESYKSPKI